MFWGADGVAKTGAGVRGPQVGHVSKDAQLSDSGSNSLSNPPFLPVMQPQQKSSDAVT